MGTAEYLIHKYTMHKKIWFLPKWIYQEHAVEHHGKNRYDINVDLPFINHLIIGSPVFILLACYSWAGLIAWTLVTLHHSIYWTSLHRSSHDLEHNWAEKLPNYKKKRRHHLLHHLNPNKNFGVVYSWVDRFFGTFIKNYESYV
tara:strand:- start:890 stop:1321 length:432 start_codon:yes stop_codon:yes gene_type:complete